MPTFLGTLNAPSDPKEAAALAATVQDGADAAAAATAAQSWTPSGGHAIASSTLIVLQNIAHGFSKPNILDLKLGARLWDDAAPAAKRARLDEVSKDSTSGSLGFRVAGMKVWDPEGKLAKDETVTEKEGYRSYDKFYGRKFRGEEDVAQAFESFLSSAAEDKTAVTERFLESLKNIQEALEAQESRMYSASVLMVFEGDVGALHERIGNENEKVKAGTTTDVEAVPKLDGEDEEDDEDLDELDDEDEVPRKIHDTKLIDFAHAAWTPGQGPDENALQGVRSIVRILERMSKKNEEKNEPRYKES